MKDNKLIEGKESKTYSVLQNAQKQVKFQDAQLKKLAEKIKEVDQVFFFAHGF